MLTKLDRKILAEFDKNARQSFSQIAKKVKTSKEVVRYHYENLQKKDILKGTYTEVNFTKIGYPIYVVYLKFQKFSADKEKEFIQKVRKEPHTCVIAKSYGKWEYSLGLLCKSAISFKINYERLMKDFETYVKEKTVLIEVQCHYFTPILFRSKGERINVIATGKPAQVFELDEKDHLILQGLSTNARISLIELAQRTELTANAVKWRIRNLEKNNIILSYRLSIDYASLSLQHHRVFLMCETFTKNRMNKMIAFLSAEPGTISVVESIGYADLEFRIVTKDLDELYALLEKLKKMFPEIKDYEFIMYYKFYETLNYYPFK